MSLGPSWVVAEARGLPAPPGPQRPWRRSGEGRSATSPDHRNRCLDHWICRPAGHPGSIPEPVPRSPGRSGRPPWPDPGHGGQISSRSPGRRRRRNLHCLRGWDACSAPPAPSGRFKAPFMRCPFMRPFKGPIHRHTRQGIFAIPGCCVALAETVGVAYVSPGTFLR